MLNDPFHPFIGTFLSRGYTQLLERTLQYVPNTLDTFFEKPHIHRFMDVVKKTDLIESDFPEFEKILIERMLEEKKVWKVDWDSHIYYEDNTTLYDPLHHILIRLNQASVRIATSTRRGLAKNALWNPKTAEEFGDIDGSILTLPLQNNKVSNNFINPLVPEDLIIVGYKGDSPVDAMAGHNGTEGFFNSNFDEYYMIVDIGRN